MVMFTTGAATAQSFVGAPSANFVLDLDTKDGASSSWRVDDLSGLNALEARVTFLRKGKHKKWAPGFSISLGDEEVQARLHVTAFPDTDILFFRTEILGTDSKQEPEMFFLPPKFGEEFELHIDWSPEGNVTFIVSSKAAEELGGYERHEVQLGRAPSMLKVSGSTGEVMFNPIKLGRINDAVTK